MDVTLRHLLLALAETLDPDVLPVLADRLGELEDVRAGDVRGYHDRARLLRVPIREARETACRYALSLFPEGPRWRVRWYYWHGQAMTRHYFVPADAATEAGSRRAADSVEVDGPLWGVPAERPEPFTPPLPRH